MVTLSFTIFSGQKNYNRAHMLFQVLCGFEPIFYTTHPNEESKKWVIIIFKWERIFSLVGSDFVCNSFYIESEVVANTSDNNTIKNQKGSEL